MGTTNVFMNPYEQPENRLTYSFLCLIEHLNIQSVASFMEKIGIRVEQPDSVEISTLYGGGSGNPDGSIHINSAPSDVLNVFLESKTWRRPVDLDQIRRHIDTHLCSQSDRLLVVTADPDDKKRLSQIKDSRVYFTTWNNLVAEADHLASSVKDPKDVFILRQFVEYVERSGEAWRAKMLDANVISSYSDWLRLRNDVERFINQSWALIEELKGEIVQSFPKQITKARMAKHWGRLGAECRLWKDSLGQWLFFGIYLDTNDHKIPFKEEFQPEFAIFLDIEPKKRHLLVEELKKHPLGKLEEELVGLGFEVNFPDIKFGNAWRLCYWREPMCNHVHDDLPAIRSMFVEKLKALFDSKFYKALEAIP